MKLTAQIYLYDLPIWDPVLNLTFDLIHIPEIILLQTNLSSWIEDEGKSVRGSPNSLYQLMCGAKIQDLPNEHVVQTHCTIKLLFFSVIFLA